MKIFSILFLLAPVLSAPVENSTALSNVSESTSTTELPSSTTTAAPVIQQQTDVYDMSQNGTDNYRLKVKGFTLLLAPSDALLGAAMMLGGLGEEMKSPTQLDGEPPNPALRTIQPHSKFSKLLHMLKKFNN